MRPSSSTRQNLIRQTLAKWRWANPRPAIGAFFEHDGQRWTVAGFEQRHIPNRPPEMRALVLESSCHICGERYTISLPSWKLSPSPACALCAKEFVQNKPKMDPTGLPQSLKTLLRDLSLVRSEISQHDFAEIALHFVPGRNRPQKLRQALKRMEQRGQFPEGVTLTPTGFRFD